MAAPSRWKGTQYSHLTTKWLFGCLKGWCHIRDLALLLAGWVFGDSNSSSALVSRSPCSWGDACPSSMPPWSLYPFILVTALLKPVIEDGWLQLAEALFSTWLFNGPSILGSLLVLMCKIKAWHFLAIPMCPVTYFYPQISLSPIFNLCPSGLWQISHSFQIISSNLVYS